MAPYISIKTTCYLPNIVSYSSPRIVEVLCLTRKGCYISFELRKMQMPAYADPYNAVVERFFNLVSRRMSPTFIEHVL